METERYSPPEPSDPDAWIGALVGEVSDMIGRYWLPRPLSGNPAVEAVILDQFRIAFDPNRSFPSMHRDLAAGRIHRSPITIRSRMDACLDWQDPDAAAAALHVVGLAMKEAQRKEAESLPKINRRTGKPWTWEDLVEHFARLLVAYHRRERPDEADRVIRSLSLGEFREALVELPQDATEERFLMTMEASGEDVPCPADDVPEPWQAEDDADDRPITASEFWALVGQVGVNWYESTNAARAVEIAGRAIDGELAA